MNTDRMLAYSVMESIHYMTGHAPKRSRVHGVLGWVCIAVIVAVVLIASTSR